MCVMFDTLDTTKRLRKNVDALYVDWFLNLTKILHCFEQPKKSLQKYVFGKNEIREAPSYDYCCCEMWPKEQQ